LIGKYKADGISWVFVQNDDMALGAAQAVDAAALKGKVKIVGVDGTKPALQAVADGGLAFDIETNPLFGKLTAQAVKDHLDGEQVKANNIVASETFDRAQAKAALDSGERQY